MDATHKGLVEHLLSVFITSVRNFTSVFLVNYPDLNNNVINFQKVSSLV